VSIFKNYHYLFSTAGGGGEEAGYIPLPPGFSFPAGGGMIFGPPINPNNPDMPPAAPTAQAAYGNTTLSLNSSSSYIIGIENGYAGQTIHSLSSLGFSIQNAI